MARPIEPTPPLEGEDASRLLDALAAVQLTPAERVERAKRAHDCVAEMMRPKGYRQTECQRPDSTVPVSK